LLSPIQVKPDFELSPIPPGAASHSG
jgi:hypothetical protein